MLEQETNKKNFSIGSVIEEGWKLVRAHLGRILTLEVVGLIAMIAVLFLSLKLIKPLSPIGPSLDWLIHTLVQCLISIACIYVGLKVADHKEIGLQDLFSQAHLILKYLVSIICYQLAIILGLICFIIPGLIIMVRFSLFGFFIVDKGASPFEALRMSWDTIRGCSWKFFFFQIVCVLLNIAGLLCLGIGVLFTFPVTVLASVLVYRSLYRQTYPNQL